MVANATSATRTKRRSSGNLRIGDHWNAITIIALSQSNPLKAVAELVENSIDARAHSIVITRGKDKSQHYLRVKDDGEGVRRNADGEPDFHYVATHVCDSIKRGLKAQGAGGLQGEFGIGLLSFWTLGEELLLTSAGPDGRTWQMHLRKGDPGYRIGQKPTVLPAPSEVYTESYLASHAPSNAVSLYRSRSLPRSTTGSTCIAARADVECYRGGRHARAACNRP